MVNQVQMASGNRKSLMSSITATTTSQPQKSNDHNAIRIYFEIVTGSGTWTIKLQGKSPTNFWIDLYDHNNNQMSMSSVTANKSQAFVYLPKEFRIVATEDSDGATVNIGYDLFSV